MCFSLYAIILLSSIPVTRAALSQSEAAIKVKLFQGGCNTDVIPRNDSRPVMVHVKYALRQIDTLNERNQQLTTVGWFEVGWNDHYLQWNPGDYENITSIVVRTRDIWIPRLHLDNSISPVFTNSDYEDNWARLYYNGDVGWEFPGVFTTQCKISLAYYPFDDQMCTLVVENRFHHGNEVVLVPVNDQTSLEFYGENGEWELLAFRAEEDNYTMGMCPDEVYTSVVFTLFLGRKYTFYVVNIISPCILLAFLIVLMFTVPIEAGERLSMGVTTLVSFTVFLVLVTESIPRTSESVPILVIFLTYILVVNTLAVALSVFVLKMYHEEALGRHKYSWINSIVNKCGNWNQRMDTDTKFNSEESVVLRKSQQNGMVCSDGDLTLKRDMPIEVDHFHEEDKRQLAARIDRLFLWVIMALMVVPSVIMLVGIPLTKPPILEAKA